MVQCVLDESNPIAGEKNKASAFKIEAVPLTLDADILIFGYLIYIGCSIPSVQANIT